MMNNNSVKRLQNTGYYDVSKKKERQSLRRTGEGRVMSSQRSNKVYRRGRINRTSRLCFCRLDAAGGSGRGDNRIALHMIF